MHCSESASGKCQIAQFLCAFWDNKLLLAACELRECRRGSKRLVWRSKGRANPAKPLVNYGLFGQTCMGSLSALKGLSLSS